MPLKDKTAYNEYMKLKRREMRNKKYNEGLPTHNIVTQPPDEIHYLKHSGQPLTMTLTDGRVIYLKYRVTQRITTS